MASIFTFDPDPPRVSSPWATPPAGTGTNTPGQQAVTPIPSRLGLDDCQQSLLRNEIPIIDNTTVTRLEAEPQEGPTEYKLHLLLKRRRSFTRFSTGLRASGSLRRGDGTSSIAVNRAVSESGALGNTPPPLISIQSRQHRLEQLTTQLLWRLQQSCPYHFSSSTAPLLPHLPDDAKLTTPEMPQRLLPGLEESKGALYEIGVADDGSIVGLAEDEMEESLNNLRAMAASLGCRVEVQRMLCVGECEWLEHNGTKERTVRKSKLLAAEALVSPDQHLVDSSKDTQDTTKDAPAHAAVVAAGVSETRSSVEQLRVSLIGATKSGKSSLLGTLSTATLDNGRGKSRLSLLKHRHEIASGMTSSVTQELIGYRDVVEADGAVSTQVISYGSGDVDAWVDIHAAVEAAQEGRLVVLSDSAGHPRFRRTTVRGIIGWQPHWTLVCVPADNTDESSGKIGASSTSQDILGPAAADLDLSQAHLELCLTLELPLVIVITKYDLATKAGLRQTLSNLLSALKKAGRKPSIISDQPTPVLEIDIQQISADDLYEAEKTTQQLAISPLSLVPIVLTSAVKGTGITKLHAFLRQLPLPICLVETPLPDKSPSHLFYIEDVYSVRANASSDRSAIIGGFLRHGRLTVGEELLLGPYPIDTSSDDSDSGSGRPLRQSPLTTSRSYPGALNKRNTPLRDRHVEWRRVRITSLRNLRLPVRALYAGQLGTIAVELVDIPVISPSIDRIRKGMVLADRQPLASRMMTVCFEGSQASGAASLAVGSAIVVYVASVRAPSKVISVSAEPGLSLESPDQDDDENAFGFGGFDDDADEQPAAASPAAVRVRFQFTGSKEFIEQGAKVLVMSGGGPMPASGTEKGAKGVTGFEGFVGYAVEQH
ncbi:P-loop containing nucleoside triphosphate hydrolase protein [Didymella exigua CBS 183.55]|uniref:P-loop containing nucleoside triphosphate hydrolase protein n=1 Tax=Didymella exigua CBS 183.55 TaxID=1150837 RepID=A0A6A5RNR0_9PLEO|nr:P-loop containing nucleoside triphosphate hydrolase protein [Didymella exigua CBS 183.55]KAF1928950.1 P-loop containing nucleoside triphosphate hydrolase protein [Didymella exigua CBS 183.55]